MRIIFFAAICSLSFASTAQEISIRDGDATPITIFGISFDAAPVNPECPLSGSPGILGYPDYKNPYFADGQVPCYVQIVRDAGKPLRDGSRINFVYPIGKDPELGRLSATISGGRLSYMQVDTRGIRTQSQDLSALTQKFGKPDYLAQPKVQNRMGASFETIEANWNLQSGVTVSYSSTTNSIDEGIVIIATQNGLAADRLRHETRMKELGGTTL